MKRTTFLKCLLALVLCWSSTAVAADKIKVACIGDSITFGVGAKPRNTMSYPAQLQKILGDKYEVMNCGKSGIKMTNYLRGWQQRISDEGT